MRTGLLFLLLALNGQAQPSTRPESTRVPSPVLAAERAWAGADVLLPLTRTADPAVTAAALRAIGRLEDVRLVPQLLPFVDHQNPDVRAAAAAAIAQTLIEVKPAEQAALIAEVGSRLRRHATIDDSTSVPAVGRIQYVAASDAAAAEAALVAILDGSSARREMAGLHQSAAVALESLFRRNARVSGFAMADDTAARLAATVMKQHVNDDDAGTRFFALSALVAGGRLTNEARRSALADPEAQVRRVAVKAIGGAASVMDESERAAALRAVLRDDSLLVRFEAVGAYARKSSAAAGCQPLLDALQDPAPHVVHAALDALATACPGDEDVTTRLAAESRPASGGGAWQRGAHAYVALARRDRERAAIVTSAFAGSPVWEVRMYAARAAAAMNDAGTLERLAADDNDNVREASLEPLRRLAPERAEPMIVGALERNDPQLLRTAALLLQKSAPSPAVYRPLADAFIRLSRLQSETTRDARLALLDATAVHGRRENAEELAPFVRDVDARVAARLSGLLAGWGVTRAAEPIPVAHPATPPVAELRQCVAVGMKNGGRFRLRMDNDAAPVTVGEFLRNALDAHIYDRHTLHRVEPNFVVQGGSPGGNEYSSALTRFMRDEIEQRNDRGAVGLSTRGRNTADGQIYIMLVDDPRLDGRFTIFAHVFPADMPFVDGIQEGDEIARVTPTACDGSR